MHKMSRKITALASSAAVTATLWCGQALAQTAPAAPAPAPTLDKADTAWMLTSTALVLLMTIPGLALFYAGMVRKKNILATIMQSFGITALVTVVWGIIGYTLAFTDGHGATAPFFGDMSRFFLVGMGKDTLFPGSTIPESVFMMFQMTFAIITPALLVGSLADRVKFSSLMVFTVGWLLLVYVPIAHMVWATNTGLLAKWGVLDFAGGTVVHINAGVAGLVGCLVIGKRKGFGTENFAPANLAYALIGASLLWVGWFGFNAGSALTSDGRAGMAMTVTQLATGAAACTWMAVEWIIRKKPSALGAASGAVAGLVAITPASGFVGPTGGLIIGLVAGVVCFWGATGLKHMLGYDDSLDSFGVHGVGGITGALLTGVFAVKGIGGTSGVLEGNFAQLGIQAEGILVTIAWCAVVSFILFKVIDKTMGLRVTSEQEVEGLDYSLHGEIIHD
ncbi:ammonia channel precursor [mine drainage metagenome]|uniref:Ammonia channel n=1 Tax=mine drainage metagenome TaxID=410659 RepID=A0A1J5RR30_9ZZZZ